MNRTNRDRFICVVFLTGACLMTSSFAADIYKWIDEHGKIHFGESPPNDEATKVEVREPNTIDRLEIVVPIGDGAQETESSLPSHIFKSYYQDDQLKFKYKTIAGVRINPTFEYYGWGDLKQKIVYPQNLLDKPITVKNMVTINNISVREEFLDSIIFDVSYKLHRTTKGSSFYLQMGYLPNYKNKTLKLVPGEDSGQSRARLKIKISEPYESEEIILRLYDHLKDNWSTIGRLDFVKIWSRGE